jgi:hypothetical protein
VKTGGENGGENGKMINRYFIYLIKVTIKMMMSSSMDSCSIIYQDSDDQDSDDQNSDDQNSDYRDSDDRDSDDRDANYPEKLDKATSLDYVFCISSVLYHFCGPDRTSNQRSISHLILSMIDQPEKETKETNETKETKETKETNPIDKIGSTCLYSLFDIRCRSTLDELFPSVIVSLILTCLPCQRGRIPFADPDDPATLLFSTVMNGYQLASNYERYYFAHLVEVELILLQDTKKKANQNNIGYTSISIILALIGLDVLEPLGKKRIADLISSSKRSAKYYSSKLYRRIILSSIGIANEELFKFCKKFFHPLSTIFQSDTIPNISTIPLLR